MEVIRAIHIITLANWDTSTPDLVPANWRRETCHILYFKILMINNPFFLVVHHQDSCRCQHLDVPCSMQSTANAGDRWPCSWMSVAFLSAESDFSQFSHQFSPGNIVSSVMAHAAPSRPIRCATHSFSRTSSSSDAFILLLSHSSTSNPGTIS